jgi:choline dehydrogenase-like flavoprotein
MKVDWRSVQYDAIVVGSGAAGGMAAKCLTDGGATVLLLEAGPELAPDAWGERERSREEFAALKVRQPIQSQNLLYNKKNCHLFVDDVDHPYATEPGAHFNWIRSRQAGGRTLVWSRFALRMCEDDFKSAEADGTGAPWPISYRDLAPYYDRVEALIGVRGTPEGLSSLPDGVFLPRPTAAYVRTLGRQLAERHPERRMIPSREVADEARAPGSGAPSYASIGSTLLQCDRQRLTLRTNCVVARIELGSSGQARGVVYVDRTTLKSYEVSARVVVLCASTIESARILLASTTPDCPAGLGNSSGALGHYLMDHFGGSRVVAAGRVQDAEPGSVERVYIPRFDHRERRAEDFARGYGIQGEFNVDARGSCVLTLGVFGEVLPRYENAVALDGTMKDACGLAVPRIRFAYSDNERRMALHAQAAIGEIVDALRFRTLVAHDAMLPPGTRAHELGGVRMGTSPKNSVLDGFNQCWDVKNLFVTDGSCFPSAGYKGPTLTIMALTARACDSILGRLRAGDL